MKINKIFSTLLLLLSFAAVNGQNNNMPKNWFNLDIEKDSVLGVSTERAYELLQGKTSKTVIVAVIDDGTDYKHEDLKDIIWTNEDEIAGNGKDDDNNGYIDDVHGWNFIGGKEGNVKEDALEVTRLYAMYSAKFDTLEKKEYTKQDNEDYKYYTEKVKPAFLESYHDAASNYFSLSEVVEAIDKIDAAIDGDITAEKLEEYEAETRAEKLAVKYLTIYMSFGMDAEGVKNALAGSKDYYKGELEFKYNENFDPRNIVGDDYNNANQRNYGNNECLGPNGDHGTHVAGIIGAVRNNNKGIKGIADNVRIMIIRVVPDGDERDKDVANGIRYAADNGAMVVNMSFGKSFGYNKQAVDEAVKYAASKDVLLVHAAGNDAKNNDETDNFPNDNLLKGSVKNWIEVGASTNEYNSSIPAEFSNYGKKGVDVFAPGYEINSTTTKNNYASYSGTSMASPVTAGVCALLRSYFPELTAEQVKEIVMKSVTPVTIKVTMPGSKEQMVDFKQLCQTGGVVNAYKAVQLAMKTKGKKK